LSPVRGQMFSHLRFVWLLRWIFRKFNWSLARCLTRIILPFLSMIGFSNYGYQDDQTLATKLSSNDVDHQAAAAKAPFRNSERKIWATNVKNSCCRQLDHPIKTPYGNLFWRFSVWHGRANNTGFWYQWRQALLPSLPGPRSV
jgi:hypothetical protein